MKEKGEKEENSKNKIFNLSLSEEDLKKSNTYSGFNYNILSRLNSKDSYRTLLDFEKKIKFKRLLENKDISFNQEFELLNNLHFSTSGEVKLNKTYEYGHLILDKYILKLNSYSSESISERVSKLEANSYRNITEGTSSLQEIEDINHPIFCIDFNLVSCKFIVHKTKKKFRLLILGKKYKNNKNDLCPYRIVKFRLMLSTDNEFSFLCKSINKSIILSKGSKENIFTISLHHYFCKEYFINQLDFYNTALTGDIILFRSFSSCSGCQRKITNGEYDHIALLVRSGKDLYVYESTGKEGVMLRKWSEFTYYLWFLLYEKITFRKLIANREAKEKFIKESIDISGLDKNKDITIIPNSEIDKIYYSILNKKIITFVSKTQNKKYDFPLLKYAFGPSKLLKISPIIKSKGGYFCSELVAAAYNFCNIISQNFDISLFLPGNFGKNEKDLELNKGFTLGQEYIIVFSS